MAKTKTVVISVLSAVTISIVALCGLCGIAGSFVESPPINRNVSSDQTEEIDKPAELVESDAEQDTNKPTESVVESKEDKPTEIDSTPEPVIDEKKTPPSDQIVHTQADVQRIEEFHKRIMVLYQAIERNKALGFNDPTSVPARQKNWLEFMRPWDAKVNQLFDEIGTINGRSPQPLNQLRFAVADLVTLSHPISFNKPQTYLERKGYFMDGIKDFNTSFPNFKIAVRREELKSTQPNKSLINTPRKWQDKSGEFEIVATFQGLSIDKKVTLLKEDGTTITISLDVLGSYEQGVVIAMQKSLDRKSDE
jgi:hypothetical protein